MDKLACDNCGNFLVPPIYSDHRNFCEKCGKEKLNMKINEVLVNSIVELKLNIKCHLCENFEGTYIEYLDKHHPCKNQVIQCVYECGNKFHGEALKDHELKCKHRKYKCTTCEDQFFRNNLIAHFKNNKDHHRPKFIVHMKGKPKFELGVDLLYVIRDEIIKLTGNKSSKISMLIYGRYGDALTNEHLNTMLEKNENLEIFIKNYSVH